MVVGKGRLVVNSGRCGSLGLVMRVPRIMVEGGK